MINSKITKQGAQQSNEERLFKLLESIDWKLWEMYNMMKDNIPDVPKEEVRKPTTKSKKTVNEQD